MSDLFHPDVPEEFIWRVIEIAQINQEHQFMILTKRPARMLDVLTKSAWWNNDTPENIWLGVSVENQRAADERIPLLLETPAAVRFVSVEPMLERIDLNQAAWGVGKPRPSIHLQHRQFDKEYASALDWVICGCESGPGARPMDLDWARDLRDQCQEAGVPFFLKQMRVDGKLVKMPELDGVVYAEYPK